MRKTIHITELRFSDTQKICYIFNLLSYLYRQYAYWVCEITMLCLFVFFVFAHECPPLPFERFDRFHEILYKSNAIESQHNFVHVN